MNTDCKHDRGTFPASLTLSLWGPEFGRFCNFCGDCLSHPTVPGRPEDAARGRALDEAVSNFSDVVDDDQLREAVDREMERWIGPDGPFREGLTWRG